MIHKEFQSPKNKNALISVIEESIQNEIGRKDLSLQSYHDGIQETMNYVQTNTSNDVPYGISSEDYLLMMNKKVYSIITPVIKKDMEDKIKNQIKKLKAKS